MPYVLNKFHPRCLTYAPPLSPINDIGGRESSKNDSHETPRTYGFIAVRTGPGSNKAALNDVTRNIPATVQLHRPCGVSKRRQIRTMKSVLMTVGNIRTWRSGFTGISDTRYPVVILSKMWGPRDESYPIDQNRIRTLCRHVYPNHKPEVLLKSCICFTICLPREGPQCKDL